MSIELPESWSSLPDDGRNKAGVMADSNLVRFAPDFTPIDGSSVFLQWKGTDVCLDFTCECGKHGHFDGYFAYAVRCGACGRSWALPHTVALVPLPDPWESAGPVDVEMDQED